MFCLLDTGSTVTILHTLKFQSLQEEQQQKLQPNRYILKMTDSGPVPYLGAANHPIQVANKVFLQDVLIADIEAPFVLLCMRGLLDRGFSRITLL